MDYSGRLRKVQASLPENKSDLLLVTHLPNIRYLCGFSGSAGALLISDRGATLFTDGRYRTQAKEEVTGARVVIARKALLVAVSEWLAGPRIRRGGGKAVLGIEAESMSVAMQARLAALLRSRAKLRAAPPLVERLRMVKDGDEIRLIRCAVEMGAGLYTAALKKIRPGIKEVEVAAAMEYQARRAGAEGMSFSTIIAAGKRSAVVHGHASSAAIPARGFVVCDFGVILAGYCSDRTRTVHVGRPSSEARQIYAAVLEAQQAAIAAVGPGVSAGDVDSAARKVLRRNNLARYFTHSTGHGLGLEIHEAPRLAAAQKQELEPGMVVTIEPGAYIPGKLGVRIEDVVVVTASGREVLTPTDKELIVVE
jgi:Xaa-Pro aminopeptidase